MAQQFILYGQNPIFNDGVIVPGAVVHYYERGTVNYVPLENGSGDPVANPVVANENGVLPLHFYNGTDEVDVIIRDANGVLVWGGGPIPRVSSTGSAADSITAVPTPGNNGTNVQAQLDVLSEYIDDAGTPGLKGKEVFQSVSSLQALAALGLTPFVSDLTTIAADAAYTYTHGLGNVPSWVEVELVCVTPAGGYLVGDIMQVAAGVSGNAGFSIVKSVTSIVVRTGTGGPGVALHRDNKTAFTIDPQNWQLRVRAGLVRS